MSVSMIKDFLEDLVR